MLGIYEEDYPKTVDEAADRLIENLPEKYMESIGMMQEKDVPNLFLSFGQTIKRDFGFLTDNSDLWQDCRKELNGMEPNLTSASLVIIKRMWKKLTAIADLQN